MGLKALEGGLIKGGGLQTVSNIYDIMGLPRGLPLQISDRSCMVAQKNISATPSARVTVTIPSSRAVKTRDNTISAHSQHVEGYVVL